ncbi:hypothetical protein KCP73_07325 [Salmonella enterica subsp. enterica]|nr:hypothetical protein KCP73_07325 [Salmonella enterica subsp. enterica]
MASEERAGERQKIKREGGYREDFPYALHDTATLLRGATNILQNTQRGSRTVICA